MAKSKLPIPASIDSETLRKRVLIHLPLDEFWSRKVQMDVMRKSIASDFGIAPNNWELGKIIRDMAKAIDALCQPPKVRQVGPVPRKQRRP